MAIDFGYSEFESVWILSMTAADGMSAIFGAFDSPEAAMKFLQTKYPYLRHMDWTQQDQNVYRAQSANHLDRYTVQRFSVLSDADIS